MPRFIEYFPLQAYTASFQPELSQAIERVVQSGRYLHGPETAAFEAEWAEMNAAVYCVGVGNGLDALTLTLLAAKQLYGWKDDAEVVVPAMTFIATAQAVLRAGLQVRLCDVSLQGVATAQTLRAALSEKTVALLPVHLYGFPAPVEEIRQIADEYGLFVLVDAAQRHPAPESSTYSHAQCFSFYPGKNLGALGDGGAVTTSDAALAERVRMLANYGATEKYRHDALGYNSRLDELQAAVLRVKARRIAADNEKRQQVAKILDETVENPHLVLPMRGFSAVSVHHIYPVLTPHRDALQKHLAQQGIQTLQHYPRAVHQQPCMQKTPVSSGVPSSFPMAERLAHEELSLPVHPLLTEQDARALAAALQDFRP